MEELKQYDLVILSDIGANTLLLPGATFNRSEKMPNRCNLISDYVNDGGALLMVGGYLTTGGRNPREDLTMVNDLGRSRTQPQL